MGVKRLDYRVRKAFEAMREKYHLYHHGSDVLDITSSDITFPVSDFPKSGYSVGCLWLSDKVPWRVRNTERVAFRSELRKDRIFRPTRHLAIMWESYGDKPTGYKVTYYTNYPQFIKNREEPQNQE